MNKDKKKKTCPLRDLDIQTPQTQCCVEEQCAWWVDTKTRQQCAVAELTILLDWIRRGYNK